MKHHATKERDTVRHLKDLPAWVLEEFKWRKARPYVLPPWVTKRGYRKTTVGANGNE